MLEAYNVKNSTFVSKFFIFFHKSNGALIPGRAGEFREYASGVFEFETGNYRSIV